MPRRVYTLRMAEPANDTLSLVRLARKGDAGAAEKLFERYLPRVRQIVAYRLGFRLSDFDAFEDLVQESLLNLFEKLDQFEERSEATFRNWVARCVGNTVLNHIRDEKAVKRGGGRVRPLSSFDSEDLSKIVFAGKDPSPSSVLRGKELRDRTEAVLLELKEHYREAIILRSFCEMSFEEVAGALGLRTEAAARKMVSRAMAELRQKLERKLEE